MSARRAVLAGLLVAVCLLATGAAGQPPSPPPGFADPEAAIRFAFVPDDLAAARAGRADVQAPLADYLEGVLSRIDGHASWKRRRGAPHVDLSAGSDYQVMAWLQLGEIDAAVVTPFMARMLLAQGAAVPVVELVRAGSGDPRGRWPLVWSPAIPEEVEETPDQRRTRELGALFQLAGFFQEAEQDAASRADGFEPMVGTSYDARFVSHLSADGFVAPVACAARWIEGRLRSHTWSSERRERVERRFWDSFLERGSFTFDVAETVRFEGPAAGVPLRFAGARPPDPDKADQTAWEPRPYAPGPSCLSPSGIDLLPADRTDRTSPIPPVPPIPNDVVVLTPHLARKLGFEPGPVALPEHGPDAGAAPTRAPGQDRDSTRSRSPSACLAVGAAPASWDPGWSPEICGLWLPPEGARSLAGAGGGPLVVGEPPVVGAAAVYAAVQPLQAATWTAFEEEMIRPLYESPVLSTWLTTFYREGRYPFRVGDLARLLRHDQAGERDPGAALVLPGGGVKSAYQARMLDILYQHHLVNAGGTATAGASAGRLPIRHVVGTSGGAIVGLLAAQTPPGGASELTGLWNQVRSSRDVFPFLNLMRAVSVLVLVWLLSAVLSLFTWRYRGAETTAAAEPGPASPAGHSSAPLIGFLLLWVVLVPLVLATVIDRADLASLGLAGFLYVATVAAAHFGLHAVVRRPGRGGATRRSRAVLALAFSALSLLVIALAVRLAAGGDGLPIPSGRWRAPAVAAVALAIQIGVLILAVSRSDALQVPPERRRRYLRAMVLVAVYGAVAYALVLVLSAAGVTPMFEITGRFWLALLACGLVAALAIVVWGRPVVDEKKLWFGERWKSFRRRTADTVSYLVNGDPRQHRVPPPRTSLVLLFTAALGWWTVCLGHSLYAAHVSFDFIDRVARARADRSPPGSPPLHANLVVTGSALERACTDTGTPRPPGDFYFCFAAPGGCPPVRLPHWHGGRADDIAQVVDAVVASGSPVPVLPEHWVTLPDGCRVPLVDGGFAHNEPIEAARHLGARQVLVVRSQPDPEALREARAEEDGGLPFPSRLVSNLGGILPFLFERSQALDQTVARSLLVAYVAPDPAHGAFPLLTDFRRPVIERMIRLADEDSRQQVGRVESWGMPRPFASIGLDGR